MALFLYRYSKLLFSLKHAPNVKEVLPKSETQYPVINLSPDHVEAHGIRFRKDGVFYKDLPDYTRIVMIHDNWSQNHAFHEKQ